MTAPIHARASGSHHPCGVEAVSNPYSPAHTRTPGPGGVSPSGAYVPAGVVTCVECISAMKRHAALCNAVRFGVAT